MKGFTMKLLRLSLVVVFVVLVASMAAAQEGLTPDSPDWFASQCQPEDESVVAPVDQMPAEPLRIAVLGLENNPFWIPVKEGTLAAAAELAPYNVTVDWIIPGETHTADNFAPGIEAAVAQGYDAIATIAGDAGVAPFIDAAVEAGIPVATFNSETDAPNMRLLFVGADLYLQGQTAARAMADAVGGEGQVAVITGFFAVEAHELRRTGFTDTIAAEFPNIEIVGEVENTDQGDIAFTQAQDFMAAYPDLKGIYVTAGGPFGAAAAVADAGKAGEVQVVSFDFVDETMQYVQDGVIYATIGQNPYAQGHDPAIRLFNYLVAGELPPCARLVTEAAVVTQDNISEYWGPAATEAPMAMSPDSPDWFASQCQPEDESVVAPVDQMPAEPLRIAVLGLENNPFWIPVKEGTLAAAAELAPYNVTVDWIIPGETHTADNFAPGIEAAVAQGYDAIATIAGDAGVAPFIDAAVEAGIPVATFNSETDAPNMRLLFVGADLYLQGQTAARAMADAVGGEGQVAVITGFFAVEAHELRRTGFTDTIAAEFPNIEIVGEVENTDQGDIAFTQAQDFMAAYPDLKGIYVTAGGPFGAAAAVADAGKAGEVQVVSFDFVDETMQYVQDGVIYATIGQNPYAQGHDPAIRLFNYLVAGEVPPCARLVTEAAVVTADNISEYWTPAQ
jgi:ABC-type sugar transport system substrate-binding protein